MLRTKLPLGDQQVLWRAVSTLEGESLVRKISELSGEPVTQILRRLPSPLTRTINGAVHRALHKTLTVAVYGLEANWLEPGNSGFKVISTITGGVSGFFGLATLAVELPITTGLMLRSIAGIAHRHGEDLKRPAARLACIEVLALGPSEKGPNLSAESSYYAARAFLAKTVSQAIEAVAERSVAQRSIPVIVELVSAVGSRFGLVVSEKVAAGAVPVVGALGGAAVNLAFMTHFQKLAQAHFAIRRMERHYGADEVRQLYHAYTAFSRRPANAR